MFRMLMLLLALSLVASGFSQVIPAHNDTIHYRSVMLQFPWHPMATRYECVVFSSDSDSMTKPTDCNQLLTVNLSFGKTYKWSYRCFDKRSKIVYQSPRYTFHIGNADLVNPEKNRFESISNSFKSLSGEGYLILDKSRVMIDRYGQPFWYLPYTKELGNATDFRDLKMTYDGNFTCINDSFAYELDINGKIIWEAPNWHKAFGNYKDAFHHDFTKLNNGNYMVLGRYESSRIHPYTKDTIKILLGTIVEFDKDKNIVWKWNSSDYFDDSDLFVKWNDSIYSTYTHINAFSTDGEYVYAGFRDKSRIIKIQKSTGKVVASFGFHTNESNPVHYSMNNFKRQHSANITPNGDIAIFNNDSCMVRGVFSSIIVFSVPDSMGEKPRILLNQSMRFDDKTTGKCLTGGNIVPLNNGNYLVGLGTNNRIVEIDVKGNKLWDMLVTRFDEKEKKFVPFMQYRASYTNHLHASAFTFRFNKLKAKKSGTTVNASLWNNGVGAHTYHFMYGGKVWLTVDVNSGKRLDVEFVIKEKLKDTSQIKVVLVK